MQFVHLGLYYNYAVASMLSREMKYARSTSCLSLFTYRRNKIVEKIPVDLGFAGFRIAFPLYRKGEL